MGGAPGGGRRRSRARRRRAAAVPRVGDQRVPAPRGRVARPARRHRGRAARVHRDVREPPRLRVAAGGPWRPGVVRRRARPPHAVRVVAAAAPAPHGGGGGVRPHRGHGARRRARHRRRLRQQAALPPRRVPRRAARDDDRALGPVVRGPHGGARRVGALATADPPRDRRARRRRSRARTRGAGDQRCRQPGALLLGDRAFARDRRRVVRRLRHPRARLHVVVRRDDHLPHRRVPRVRSTPGALHHRTGDGPRGATMRTRPRRGAAPQPPARRAPPLRRARWRARRRRPAGTATRPVAPGGGLFVVAGTTSRCASRGSPRRNRPVRTRAGHRPHPVGRGRALRLVGDRHRVGAPRRHRDRRRGIEVAGPGARDGVRPGGRRRARHRRVARERARGRHRSGALRHGHLGEPQRGDGRRRGAHRRGTA